MLESSAFLNVNSEGDGDMLSNKQVDGCYTLRTLRQIIVKPLNALESRGK